MRVSMVSFNTNDKIKKKIKNLGFTLVNDNPEVVISAGGDGTLLYSEMKFPTIPKIVFKTSSICRKCDYPIKNMENILLKVKKGKYKIREEMKLEAAFKGKTFTALNEIQVHNKMPTRAIRFSLQTNGKTIEKVIADGVIIATPFGSTAYYASAGGKPFSKGIGVVLNNVFSPKDGNFIVPDSSRVKVRLMRESAWLVRDNDEWLVTIKEGEELVVKRAKEVARFVEVG